MTKEKKSANWTMGDMFHLMKENGMEPEELRFSPKHLAKMIDITDSGTVVPLSQEKF